MAIWGDRALPDPWAGRLVGLSTEVDKELPVHDAARAVTVHAVAGYVAPMPLFQAISSAEWGQVVTWRDPPSGRVIEAAVRRADAAEALRLAEAVTVVSGTPRLPGDALGSQTAAIYDDFPIAPYGPLFSEGTRWTLSYRSGRDTGGRSRLLTVGGLDRPAADLQAMRFWALTTETISVHGRVGMLYAAFDRDTGPFGVIFSESRGRIVQVVGLGLDRSSVVDVAKSLVPVSQATWRTLQRQTKSRDCAD